MKSDVFVILRNIRKLGFFKLYRLGQYAVARCNVE